MSRRGIARRHRRIHASPRREDLDLVMGRWKVRRLIPQDLWATSPASQSVHFCMVSVCVCVCVCVQVVEVLYEPYVRHSDSDDEVGAGVSDHMDIAGQFKG